MLGVNIRTLRGFKFLHILRVISEALNEFMHEYQSLQVLFVPFGFGSMSNRFYDDRIATRLLARRLNHAERFYVIQGETDPSTILGVYRFIRVFVGVRYHSIMLSHILETPVFGT